MHVSDKIKDFIKKNTIRTGGMKCNIPSHVKNTTDFGK